jgi:hypothetical protein
MESSFQASSTTSCALSQQLVPVVTVTRVPVPSGSFTLFPRLPIELRLAVWELSFPCSRCASIDIRRPCGVAVGEHKEIIASLPVPITLAINQESRCFPLKSYVDIAAKPRTPIFPWYQPPTRLGQYFNPNKDLGTIDVLSFGSGVFCRSKPFQQWMTLNDDIVKKIKTLQLRGSVSFLRFDMTSITAEDPRRKLLSKIRDSLEFFGGLQKLELLADTVGVIWSQLALEHLKRILRQNWNMMLAGWKSDLVIEIRICTS